VLICNSVPGKNHDHHSCFTVCCMHTYPPSHPF
jgi:hypothetical protein